MSTLLSREQMIELRTERGQELYQQDIEGDLFIGGVAAMSLAYSHSRVTADVDGVLEPKTVIYRTARSIADRHGLPSDWLNDGVKGLLPGPDPSPREILQRPGLRVSVPSPRYLLALKVVAARVDRDQDDIRVLAKLCGVTSADEVLNIAEDVIGSSRPIPVKSQYLVESMFSEMAQAPTVPDETPNGTWWHRWRKARRRK